MIQNVLRVGVLFIVWVFIGVFSDIFYSILLASPVTDQLIINKCLVGTGAPTAVSQLQWSRSLQDM